MSRLVAYFQKIIAGLLDNQELLGGIKYTHIHIPVQILVILAPYSGKVLEEIILRLILIKVKIMFPLFFTI